ncbi:MAG: hypothetical protein LBB05_00720 [Puniceicoccales bacterium]|nr:hypothetical protein [Puniceicoccales bacterium]
MANKNPEPQEAFRSEEQGDDIVRLTQAIKDYLDRGASIPVVHPLLDQVIPILLDHLDRPDLDTMFQALIENLSVHDLGGVIQVLKGSLDLEEQIQNLKILEERLTSDDLTLPLSALDEENRTFVKECNPEGCESETIGVFNRTTI